MKNTISWASSLALSTLVAVLPLASCQKETRLADQSTTPQTITRTIAAEAEPIDSPETKSVYESGVGVHLTNSEYMSVYYAQSNSGGAITGLKSQIKGFPDNSGHWTFSHEAISEDASYDYAFVLPLNSKNEINGKGTQFKLRLYFVQYPTATSFDPNMDYLLGQAKIGVSQSTAVNEIKFKRLFAPVRLDIYDTKGVLGTEKIHAVSLTVDKEATKTDALLGWAYVTPSADFESAAVSSFTSSESGVSAPHYGNSVSALNASGIEKADGKYSVWFIMNPSEIPAGTNIKLEVTTDTKTITRTSALLSAKAIERNKINVIGFDVSKDDTYTAQNSGYKDFSTLSSSFTAEDMQLTDGTQPLSGTSCSMRTPMEGSTEPKCLTITKSTTAITIAPVEGKSIDKIRIYTHFASGPSNNCNQLELKSGDTSLATKYARFSDVASTAGYVDFDVPEANASSTLTISAKQNAWVSGITLFYK